MLSDILLPAHVVDWIVVEHSRGPIPIICALHDFVFLLVYFHLRVILELYALNNLILVVLEVTCLVFLLG